MDTELAFLSQLAISPMPFLHLETKFHVPTVSPLLIDRPRLQEQLDQCKLYKLLLVSAPAGYGKTTLLSRWSEQSQCPVTWVSLDTSDNDPTRFWSYVIGALDKLDADFEHLLPLLHSAEIDITYVVTGLINAVTCIPDHFVLVLDDYHLIRNETIHQSLTFFLDHLPAQMHLILSSRELPPFPLGRWRTRGQLLELTIDDLRFSENEIESFLRQAVSATLSPAETGLFYTRTEGWAASLHLAALLAQGEPENCVADILGEFQGDHRFVVEYLATEVLQQQPEYVRNFLLQTSILQHLYPDACNAITGRSDSQQLLTQLAQKNLFTMPQDKNCGCFRYHHLFAQFLQNQLEQNQPDKLVTLHQKTADWFEQQGDVDQTIYHNLHAQNYNKAAKLIEPIARQRIVKGELCTVLGWFNTLPEDVIKTRPVCCIYYAWVLTHSGQLEKASRFLNALDGIDLAQAEHFAGKRAIIQARMALMQGGKSSDIVSFSEEALARLPADDYFLRSEVALDLAFAHDQNPGDFAVIRQAFENAYAAGQQAHNPRTAMMAAFYLARSYLNQGTLQQAARIFHNSLQWAEQNPSAALEVCWAYTGLGELYYEWDNLEEATNTLQSGLTLGQQSGEVKVQIYANTMLARIYQIEGQFQKATEALQTAQEAAHKTNITSMIQDLDVEEVFLHLKEGHLEHAANWVQYRGIKLNPQQPESFENIILIMIAIAQAQMQNNGPVPAAYIEVLQKRAEYYQNHRNIRAQVSSLILLAAALETRDDRSRAVSTLESAVKIAQPLGLVRTLADEILWVTDLIGELAQNANLQDYVGQITSNGTSNGKEPLQQSIAKPQQETPLVEPLREREIEVLQHIAAGHSNKEIAEDMVIAVSTVKWHLKNIYGKLNVNRRTQALAKARELQLL